MTKEEMITDKELEDIFQGTSYGSRTPRDIVKTGLMKVVAEYHNGYTTQHILRYLGLTTEKDTLTDKGKKYIYEAFRPNVC